MIGTTIRLLVFKFFQVLWTSVAGLKLLWERIVHGPEYFQPKVHERPKCLDGWDDRYIQLPDVRLHYVQTGSDDKPLFLMVHGFPEFWYSWRFQLKHFQDKYRCVAVDQRGYNLSEKPGPTEAYNVDLLAKDMRDLILALGYKTAVVMGHDWGAAVVWRLSMRYPEVLERIVILNVPHPKAMSGGGISQLLKSWYIFFFQTPYLPELSISANDFKMLNAMFHGKKGGLKNKSNVTNEDVEAFKHIFSQPDALTPPINYYRCLPTVRNISGKDAIVQPPVLIVWGTADAFLTVAGAKKSIDYCRDGRLHLIEGASHWVMQDEPEEVNKAIEQFLAESHSEVTVDESQSKL